METSRHDLALIAFLAMYLQLAASQVKTRILYHGKAQALNLIVLAHFWFYNKAHETG